MAAQAALAACFGSDSEDDDDNFQNQAPALPPRAIDHPTFTWLKRLWPPAAATHEPSTVANAATRLARDIQARAPALCRTLRDTGGGGYAADAAAALAAAAAATTIGEHGAGDGAGGDGGASRLLATLARGPCAARARNCDELCATAREERGGWGAACWRVAATFAVALQLACAVARATVADGDGGVDADGGDGADAGAVVAKLWKRMFELAVYGAADGVGLEGSGDGDGWLGRLLLCAEAAAARRRGFDASPPPAATAAEAESGYRIPTTLPAASVCTVPTLDPTKAVAVEDAAALTPAAFANRYLGRSGRPGIPVVIKGHLIGWDLDALSDLLTLRNEHGGRLLPITLGSPLLDGSYGSGGGSGGFEKRVMPLRAFVDEYLRPSTATHQPAAATAAAAAVAPPEPVALDAPLVSCFHLDGDWRVAQLAAECRREVDDAAHGGPFSSFEPVAAVRRQTPGARRRGTHYCFLLRVRVATCSASAAAAAAAPPPAAPMSVKERMAALKARQTADKHKVAGARATTREAAAEQAAGAAAEAARPWRYAYLHYFEEHGTVGCAVGGVKNFALVLEEGGQRQEPAPSAASLATWAEGCMSPTPPPPSPPPDEERHVATAYCSQHPLFHQLPHLLQSFCVPAYGLGRIGMAPPNAWIGTRGTVTTLHSDPDENLLCQVAGWKYVRLYARDQGDRLYARTLRAGTPTEFGTSPVRIERPDLVAHPLFADAVYTECILHPGDVLYLPKQHWHYVRSLTTSVSVNFW